MTPQLVITPRSRTGRSLRAARRGRRAFTLIEMLLVVAIIVLLLSLLLPVLHNGKEAARETECRVKLHNMGNGFHHFAMDHRRVLPAASHGAWEGAELWQKSWIGKEAAVPGRYAPAADSPVMPYFGSAGKRLYRCPSRKTAPIGSGIGSNGSFDFAMMLSFGGARITALPNRARYEYLSDPLGPPQDNLPTPVIVEEDPAYHNNSLSIEPGFGSIDRSPIHHLSRGSNYYAADGSVNLLKNDQPRPPEAWEWFARSPRGHDVRLNGHQTYGSWHKQ